MLAKAPDTDIIRQLNDQFRRTLTGGRILLTPCIAEMSELTRAAILKRITDFDEFNDANDPHGEHDFIAFELGGANVFAKIDYYNSDLTQGSDDPADTSKTTRVMTIMMAEEY